MAPPFDGEEGKGGPPSWDGSLADLTRYERDVKWYVAGTEDDKRKMCGPRLARALSGRAKDIIEEMGPAEIDKVSALDGSGPKFLVDFIKERIGDPAVSEVATEMENMFVSFKRQRNEAMGAYLARFSRTYSKLTAALQAVLPVDSKGVQKKMDKEWLPEIVRGWMVLTRCSLTATEQAAVVASAGNLYDMSKVSAALKTQWTEKRLSEHDKQQFAGRSGPYGFAVDDAEDEDDCDDLLAEADHDLNEDEVAEYAGDCDMEELYVAAQEAAKTWVAARAAMRQAKTSRGFYGKGGRGKGKGKGKGQGPDQPFQGNCLRCGVRGHRARDCPKRAEDAGKGGGVAAFAFQASEECMFDASEKASNEAYLAVLDAATEGFAALDCGATSSIGGLTAIQSLSDISSAELGCDTIVDASMQKTFRFGNGTSQTCLSRVELPMKIGNQVGSVSFNVLDAPAPALLGMDFLQKSGAVVNFDEGSVVFKRLSPSKHWLKKLTSGHLAVRLAGRGQVVGRQPAANSCCAVL